MINTEFEKLKGLTRAGMALNSKYFERKSDINTKKDNRINKATVMTLKNLEIVEETLKESN